MTGRYEAAFVDLDGTVYRGDSLIGGADSGVETLRAADVDVLFVSNKAIERRGDYVRKLTDLGVDVSRDRVVNSGWVTAVYVADRYPDIEAFVVGEDPLIAEFETAGVAVTRDSPGDLLVVSMDRSFTYERLDLAMRTLDGGGPFLATNPDRRCPTETGAIPDAASMIGAVEGVTGREPDAVLGKPSETMVETATEAVGAEPDECLVVGDRLETDILMGERAGMTTVLVLSGVTDRETLAASDVEPDHVVDSLGDIARVLD